MSFGGRSKTPCKYFQQGRCKKGNSCNFAHVYTGSNASNGGSSAQLGPEERYQSFISATNLNKISTEIQEDMKGVGSFALEPLSSSYSLSSPCAVNLIQGRDYSPEESRFLYYQARLQNGLPAYETQVEARRKDVQKCFDTINRDTRKAARYLQLATQKVKESGSSQMKDFIEHPLDLTGQSYGSASSTMFGSSNNPFGATAAQTTAVTNNPQTGAFGASGFGQQNLGGGAFGAPSFGSTTANSGLGGAFGQPKFGSSGLSASSGSGSAFGAPAFGSNTTGSSAFGKPNFASSMGGQGSPFGASSAPATETTVGTNAFGSGSSAFGKPAFGSNASSSPFASIQSNQSNSQPFGSAQSTNTTTSGPFSAASNSSQGASGLKSFAQNLDGAKPFGSAVGFESGSSSNSAFKPGSTPAFGSASAPAFGSASTPAFGSASTQASFWLKFGLRFKHCCIRFIGLPNKLSNEPKHRTAFTRYSLRKSTAIQFRSIPLQFADGDN